MITETNLIKIAVIKVKHLKQIRPIPYGLAAYKQLTTDLLEDKLTVTHWISGESVGSSIDRMWLVVGPNNDLSLMIPPDSKDYEGKPVPLWEKFKDVPQLFTD